MTLILKLRPAAQMNKVVKLVTMLHFPIHRQLRLYSENDSSRSKQLTKSNERADLSTDVRPLGEKIKQTTKTVSYTGVIVLGLGVTGVIFYYVFRELFSSNSPNSIYSAALEKCKNDPRVEEALGAPIKGFGEETSRRRRTHISHAIYEKDGINHMRMRFYIKGLRNKGVVELDMKQLQKDLDNYDKWRKHGGYPIMNANATLKAFKKVIAPDGQELSTSATNFHMEISQNDFGNYECRYLLVQLEDYSARTFIIEDNRAKLDKETNFQSAAMPALSLSQ